MAKQQIQIIHSDDDILVVNKPSGVSVTRDRTGNKELTDLLAAQIGKDQAAQLLLVHRLDKDTSGVILLAKNKDAQRLYSGFFAKKIAHKTYLAIVKGYAGQKSGTINKPISPLRGTANKMCIGGKRAKEAVTDWHLLADFTGAALLAVSPRTGRTHQIRVHLTSEQMPLAVDPLYFTNRPLMLSEFKPGYSLGKYQTEKPLIERLTLHAYQLEISDPDSSINWSFVAPLDKKFTATLKMLTKYNSKGPDAFTDPSILEKILAGEKIETKAD